MTPWRAYLRDPAGLVGLILLLIIVALATAAPILYPGDPWRMAGPPLLPPLSPRFPLGTDSLGRNVAAGLFHGAAVSLAIGVISSLGAIVLGTAIGAVAGYFGGWVDDLAMRTTEFFQTVPSFLLAIVLLAIFTPTMTTTVIAITIVSWTSVARLVRAEFLTLRNRDFVKAAIVAGQSAPRIIFCQVLPNALSPVIISGSLMVATAILTESALSFLGLGDRNHISWGYMIGAGRTLIRQAWWLCTFPGLAIVITVIALSLIGQALNDVLNPRLRGRL